MRAAERTTRPMHFPMRLDDALRAIKCLDPSPLVREFAEQIVEKAGRYPILNLAGGGGRHAFLLASLGAEVICLDKDLGNFKCNRSRIGHRLGNRKLRAMEADVLRDPWPFGPSTLGGIVNVHFLEPQLFDRFAYSLRAGAYLLIETPGGQAGNYFELPRAGSMKNALGGAFEFEFYREQKVGPPGVNSVSVGLLAKKKGG